MSTIEQIRQTAAHLAHAARGDYATRMPTLSPLLALSRAEPAAARARILEALTATGGNRTHAATALGVSRITLWRCVVLAAALPEVEARWPGSSHGGGARSAEHRAAIGVGQTRAWARRGTAATAKKSAKRRGLKKSTG